MTDDSSQARAQELIRELNQLQSIRYNWESYWADIARRLLPHQNVFMRPVLGIAQAERRTEYIFDSTPPQALEDCAALFESMLFPRTQRWHKLTPTNPALKENKVVRSYLEDITDILFAARYSPKANFASQAHENMLGLTAFGTGCLFTDEKMGEHIRYRAIPLQDLYFAENHVGVIDTVFRKFPFSATQAAEQWGADKLPAGVKAAYDNPAQKHREFEFLHVVRPRKKPEVGRADSRGMALESFYVCITQIQMMEESGFRTMPYAPSRYIVGPREVYGRSPAFTNLADIKMVNEMSRSSLNAKQIASEPPVLLSEAGRAFSLRPSALNYGMISDDGKPLAMPFVSGAKTEVADQELEFRRKSIRKGFYGDLFQMLMDHPDMTATQALLLAQERGILLTPGLGRQQSEFLGVMIQRELDILAHAGQLPPMPPELMLVGGMIDIEYSSPLNQLQKAQDGVNIQQSIQQMAKYAEASGDSSIFKLIDSEKLGREIWDVNGSPADILLSPDELAAKKQQEAQAQNAQALINAAPQAAAAAKDLATAHSTAMNAPPPQPGVGGPPA